jgi:hypothetical protein
MGGDYKVSVEHVTERWRLFFRGVVNLGSDNYICHAVEQELRLFALEEKLYLQKIVSDGEK